MKKWEYLVKEVSVSGDINIKDTQDRLDDFGEDGWEVCGTLSRESGNGCVILKRELEG